MVRMTSLLEFLAEVPLQHHTPEEKSSEPFNYLLTFKKMIQSRPGCGPVSGKFKVVSSTLASKMSLKKTADGSPRWNVEIMLNDGSDFIKAAVSSELLDQEIGSALQYLEIGDSDPAAKAAFKQRMKQFSLKLADFNYLVTLKYENSENPCTLVKMEEISGLHLAQMRKRKR